jgi:hypothetical protein
LIIIESLIVLLQIFIQGHVFEVNNSFEVYPKLTNFSLLNFLFFLWFILKTQFPFTLKSSPVQVMALFMYAFFVSYEFNFEHISHI